MANQRSVRLALLVLLNATFAVVVDVISPATPMPAAPPIIEKIQAAIARTWAVKWL